MIHDDNELEAVRFEMAMLGDSLGPLMEERDRTGDWDEYLARTNPIMDRLQKLNEEIADYLGIELTRKRLEKARANKPRHRK